MICISRGILIVTTIILSIFIHGTQFSVFNEMFFWSSSQVDDTILKPPVSLNQCLGSNHEPWTIITKCINCIENNGSDERLQEESFSGDATLDAHLVADANIRRTSTASKQTLTPNKIGMIGVPLRYGQNKDGPQLGPNVLRRPLLERFAGSCSFVDHGNLNLLDSYMFNEYHDLYEDHNFGPDSVLGTVVKQKLINNNNSGCDNAMFPKTVADAVYKIEDAVSSVLNEGSLPLTLGGDHALVMATVEATGKKFDDLVFIHIDAHGDINTIKSSTSGHIHGAPLSFVVEDEEFQEQNSKCEPFKLITPVIKPSQLAFIGLRDLDDYEKDAIKRLNITAFTSGDVSSFGPKDIVKRVFDAVNPNRDRPVHISFDIDSVDPSFAPSTGTSVPKGLSRRDAIEIAKEISKTGTLVALDIAEVNPLISPKDASKTIDTAVDVTMAFLSGACNRDANNEESADANFLKRAGRRRKA